jgi:hypothetical protein
MRGDESVRTIAENARIVKTAQFINSESVTRHGYEAFFWSFARVYAVARFVTVDTDRIEG